MAGAMREGSLLAPTIAAAADAATSLLGVTSSPASLEPNVASVVAKLLASDSKAISPDLKSVTQDGNLLPEFAECLKIIADSGSTLSLGHVTRREQWVIVNEMARLGATGRGRGSARPPAPVRCSRAAGRGPARRRG